MFFSILRLTFYPKIRNNPENFHPCLLQLLVVSPRSPPLSFSLHLLAAQPQLSPFSLSQGPPAGGALCSSEPASTTARHAGITHHGSWWKIAASLWSLHITTTKKKNQGLQIRALSKIKLIISQPKHMLLVLKRTISLWQVFLSTQNIGLKLVAKI